MNLPELTDKERVALKIVNLAKAQALADNHFLATAIGRLKVKPATFLRPFSTDGRFLFTNVDMLCDQFKVEQHAPKHDLMHTVLHCVFLHPYVSPKINRRFWELACDIAVERSVAEACGPRDEEASSALESALDLIGQDTNGAITAEKIYRGLLSGKWDSHIEEWESAFLSDDHTAWYVRSNPWYTRSGHEKESGREGHARSDNQTNPAQSPGNAKSPTLAETRTAADTSSPGDERNPHPAETLSSNYEKEKSDWNRVAKALAVDLQTYSKGRGKSLGSFVKELETSSRERVDYADFLRQFAIPGEAMRLSDDEFDYVYYTYGLKLYGNLPLIEPLEYREEKRIREFAIVIDTSGSVYNEIVKSFIDTTFDILESTKAFFERVHIRIIQCDAAVQSDKTITNVNELKKWGNTVKIHGGGGTDFRPAFAYVDKLVENGEFENLGGLIYFTDGWGAYPEWMPEYKTAFVFYGDYRPECVPTWAAQIVLDENSILRNTDRRYL